MNFFKRAIRSVTRQKSKSLILFAVIFLLGNILAGSVVIQQATQNVEKTTKEQMGAIATVSVDYNDEKIMKELEKNGYDVKPMKEKLIKEIGKSSYVKSYDYSETYGFQSKDLKTYDPQSKNNEATNEEGTDGYVQSISIHGVQEPKIMDIILGKIKLVDGVTFTKEQVQNGESVVVVSKQFADSNGLHVGDDLTIDNTLTDDYGKVTDKSFDTQAKVIGIYQVLEAPDKKTSQSGGNDMTEYLNFEKYNTFYMPNQAVHQLLVGYFNFIKTEQPDLYQTMIGDNDEEVINESYYTPIYQLKTVDDIEKFKAETKPLLPKYYTVAASTDEFEKQAGQFTKLSKIAKAVIIAAVILSIVLILLVILLFMRDRKRELGIYLSLGDKKSNIIMQIMVEVLTIAVIALVLSLFTGKFLGGFASEAFLNSEQAATTSNTSEMFFDTTLSGLGNGIDAETIANNYSVSFTPFYIVTYLLVGLGTVIISVLLSTLYIFKLKPKKILLG